MKAVISYLMVLFFAIGYMFAFDSNAGLIMTVFIVIVPLLSVFITLFTRKRITVGIKNGDELIKKNKEHIFMIEAEKSTVIPIPIVGFKLKVSDRISTPDYTEYRFSMSENKQLDISVGLIPEICGPAEIEIRDMYIMDYLGVFRFRLKTDRVLQRKVYILPEIKELNDGNEIIKSISNMISDDDDEKTDTVNGKTAFPGYEYRKYYPGDPIKKINWKLSAKKKEYFIRMDESAGMTMPNIIIDPNICENLSDITEKLKTEQNIVEGALSMLSICVRHNVGCNCIFFRNGLREEKEISSYSDVEKLACDLAEMEFEKKELEIKHFGSIKSNDLDIVFTMNGSDEESFVVNSEKSDDHIEVVVPESVFNKSDVMLSNLWVLKEDCSIERIS